jgi:sodium/proline symporter
MDAVTIGFTIYLITILLVGFYTARITRNLKDFALGGQRLGPTVIAFSERASGESAWLILGLPGAALVAGMLELWTVVGCVSGIIISWLIVAYPLRKATGKYNALTLPQLFENKFNDLGGKIRLVASLIITFFFTFYVAAQFSGAGKVLNVTFGISEFNGMIIGAVIIVFYTLMGGFLAVAWTDLIQGIIMIGTLVILPLAGFIELSGSDSTSVINWSTLYGGKTGSAAFAAAVGGLSWGLGYMGQPHLVARYMAIDDAENIAASRRIAYLWAVPAFFGAMFIGLIGAGLINNGLLQFNGAVITSIASLPDPEKLMPIMASNLLPAWLAGIFISGAIAAMMSTADSQLLVSTTVLTEDITRKYAGVSFTDKKLLFLGRSFTLVIGVAAFYLAWKSNDLVFEMVSYAWGGLGASFGPALVLTLWWKGIKKEGVLAGLICGTLFTIFPIFGTIITPRLSAFIISTLAVILVSKFRSKTN